VIVPTNFPFPPGPGGNIFSGQGQKEREGELAAEMAGWTLGSGWRQRDLRRRLSCYRFLIVPSSAVKAYAHGLHEVMCWVVKANGRIFTKSAGTYGGFLKFLWAQNGLLTERGGLVGRTSGPTGSRPAFRPWKKHSGVFGNSGRRFRRAARTWSPLERMGRRMRDLASGDGGGLGGAGTIVAKSLFGAMVSATRLKKTIGGNKGKKKWRRGLMGEGFFFFSAQAA